MTAFDGKRVELLKDVRSNGGTELKRGDFGIAQICGSIGMSFARETDGVYIRGLKKKFMRLAPLVHPRKVMLGMAQGFHFENCTCEEGRSDLWCIDVSSSPDVVDFRIRQAKMEGYQAYKNHRPDSDNQYPIVSAEWFAWNDGFDAEGHGEG